MDHRLFLDNDDARPRGRDRPAASLVRGDGGWVPEMNEPQLEFYWDLSPYVLATGERFSGKTTAGLHKIVRHCYTYDSALAIVVVIVKTGAKAGGAWEQLLSLDYDHEGRRWGTLAAWNEAVGLRYTDEYGDDAKNKWIDIETVNGGSSSILLLSMPYGAYIADRIKNMTPSYFHFEELTNTDSSVYFTKVIQQLGRRAAVPSTAQQYVATCNPADEGESHWVFKTFFVHKPSSPRGGPQPGYDPKGYNPYTKKREGWNENFGVHHLPANLNVYVEDMAAYQARIMEDTRDDPTAYDRLILGRWVAKISGDGIFKNAFVPEVHVKGEMGRTGLLPVRGHPIIVGYDPGDANNARVFMQRLLYRRRWHWRIFDALCNFNEHMSYDDLIRLQMDRMLFWCDRLGHTFDFQRVSARLIEERPDKYGRLHPIRMKAPDKGEGSVGERVRCVRNCLHGERIHVSALCQEVIDMFQFLKKARGPHGVEIDDKPQKTRKGHIHTFDGTSYPIYFYESSPVLQEIHREEELECGTF
ncbi:MAG: hypothetical protein ACLFR7_09985 [Opitutales bacterium]